MPVKKFQLENNLTISVTKRKSSKSVKLSISPKGEVKVSIPRWTPYSAAIVFAESKRSWIQQNLPDKTLITDGQLIGKDYFIKFLPTDGNKLSSRLKNNFIYVYLPSGTSIDDQIAQDKAQEVSIKALRKQAEDFIPKRTSQIAEMFGYEYNNIKIKQLKGRWGSCDQNSNLTFNLFLMQIPDSLIDYVIVHELVHTVAHNHGPVFWQEFEKNVPSARQLKKQLKNYRPTLSSDQTPLMA